jgi:hypothetical protein
MFDATLVALLIPEGIINQIAMPMRVEKFEDDSITRIYELDTKIHLSLVITHISIRLKILLYYRGLK